MRIRRFPHKPRVSTVVNMNDSNAMALGGRLPILGVTEMNAEQRKLADKIVQRRGRRGDEAGYRTTTDDGALIGPFNAFLRAPEVGDAYLAWAQAVAASSLSRQLTEACILGVTARWQAPYMRYAHTRAARQAGISDDHIDSILRGNVPASASPDVAAALHLVTALLDQHVVPDDVYDAVRAQFTESQTVALVCLIGQYMTTSAILACFTVPAPA